MQRYFSNLCNNNEYLLSSDDSYHIKKVMRMNMGEKIEIVDNKKVVIGEIISFDPVKAKIVEELSEYNENDKQIILVQSLVNETKMDYVLQKGCELGVNEFYPFKAHNSVVKENDKSNKKILRWQKIVKEAAEQSKRNIIPKVNNIVDIKELCQIKADVKLLLSVKETSKNIKNILKEFKKYDTLILVIGPEGGFTPLEEETLIKNGFISTSLGKRVLRTETAGMVALSMINYEWMV